MDIEKLCNTFADLVQHMQADGYSESYILRLRREVNWLVRNKDREGIHSYEDACRFRGSTTESPEMQEWYRLAYGVLKRFESGNEYPDGRRKEPLIKRGAYPRLTPAFKELTDCYRGTAARHGLKEKTIRGNASNISCFLLAMQDRGCQALDDITEEDVMSFFTDGSGNAVLSSSYRRGIAAVLSSDLGADTEPASRILTYLPKTRTRRKNIPYLTSEEADAIHRVLSDGTGRLSLRDRAVGYLLFFTGIRGCDIIKMEFSDIDWGGEEIRLTQQKTGNILILPLTAAIGNAIFDYITMERPPSEDPHIFLSELKPHDPMVTETARHIADSIYRAAGIRQEAGSRRGARLFRYHAASTFMGNGIARPIISDTLGHTDPKSLDYYISADIEHLRECSLSIGCFPVREEVFRI